MKKLGIIVVVLAVVLLVAPFGIGKMAEKRLNASIDRFIEEVPYFKVSERTWSGGWFTSKQTVTFELADTFAKLVGAAPAMAAAMEADEDAEAEAAMTAEGTELDAMAAAADAEGDDDSEESPFAGLPDGTPFRFTIHNDVLHGPILGSAGVGLARVDTHLDLTDEVRQKIQEVFGTEKPALQMRTRVSFFGGGTTTFKSEGRKLDVKEKDVEFTYDTFKLSVGYSRNADSYDIDGGLPRIEVKDASDGTHFVLTGLTIDGDGKRVLDDLYDGDFAFKVKEVDIKGKGGSGDMLIQDAHYIVKQETKNDFVNMAAQFGTGVIKSNELKMVNIEVKEIHYDFSLRHLHAPTLAKITGAMKTAYTMALSDPSQLESAVVAPLMENATELLKHDPEFGIDRIGLVTPEGEIMAKGLIKLIGATPEDFTAGGGMGLVGKLDADITITASQKVLEKFPNGATMAGGAVDAGYAKRDGDKLVCQITFKAGQLLINGKPQSIPGVGGPPPGAGGGMAPMP